MARTFEATVSFVSTDEEPYAACDAPSLYLPRQLCRSLDLSVGDLVSGTNGHYRMNFGRETYDGVMRMMAEQFKARGYTFTGPSI